MAMFGGRRRGVDLGAIGNLLLGSNEVARRRMLAQDTQDRALAEQRRMAETTIADRLRSQLSPMDGPNGSGTGAMPGIEQQMAALDEARLMSPEVANQFAPIVAERARQQQAPELFANDPRAQMLYRAGNQSFMDSLGEQYKPQVIGAGGVQSVIGQGRTVTAPSFSTVNDTIYRNDPATGQSTPTATAPPSFRDQTGRLNANTATLGQGAQLYQNGQMVAQNSQPRPIPESVRRDNEKDQMAIDDRTAVIARLDNAIGLIQNDMINLDPMSRASAWVRNNTGNSSPQSQAAAELRRTVESLRNSILNDATGPQTDGDSLRALNQIIQGWGDETVVMQGIQAYRDIQARKTESQRRIMAQREAQYGGQGQPQAGPQGQGGPRPRARNPQTGQVVEFNGSQWVPVQ